MLERLAIEYGGKFVLAKVNIDENPTLAQVFRVQSIPLVLGVRDGGAAARFLGALPEPAVREFLQRLLPSDAEELAKHGDELFAAQKADEAEATFRRALDLDARCEPAMLGLARVLAARDGDAEALELLDRIVPGTPIRQEADRLAAEIRVRGADNGPAASADEAALRARVDADPQDLEARFSLAQLLAAASRYEQALDHYLEIVKQDRSFQDDAARKAMLDVFEVLGADNPLVERYRSALAKVLFA
jgi:putative thioredoxin